MIILSRHLARFDILTCKLLIMFKRSRLRLSLQDLHLLNNIHLMNCYLQNWILQGGGFMEKRKMRIV